jgi:hypothetical protein
MPIKITLVCWDLKMFRMHDMNFKVNIEVEISS